MQVTTIKVSLEGYGIWGGMEAQISPEENPIDEWIKLKELVQLAMNQSDSMKGTVVTQVDKMVDRVSGIVEAIKSCTTVVALERFKQMVEREDNEGLNELYELKLQALNKIK
jgi:hypothetical protein